jgi:hypothetical protein
MEYLCKNYDIKHDSIIQLYNKALYNKTYSWELGYIKFLYKGEMEAFGHGHYYFINKWTVIALFGGHEHTITFDTEFCSFISKRLYDGQEICGCIIAM